MEKIPFNPQEMTPIRVQPGFPGAPDRNIFNSPVTLKENFLAAMFEHDCCFVPYERDIINVNVEIIPDNKARATVMDGREEFFVPNPEGELDAFGVTWIYDPKVNGSMVRPGAPLLEDIEDWEEVVKFPNPQEWDWEGQAKKTEQYRSDSTCPYMSTIFTGFFERLISWMDFENAAIAMIDEDSQEYVKAIFDRLADLYIEYIDLLKKWFDIDGIELHDDWGSQQQSFMSEATYREMVMPYMKRVADHAHELGLYFQLHSCGRIENLVPMMIEIGVDTWMGQVINDKPSVVAQYGDKICVQVELPELAEDASDEEIEAAAQEWAADYLIPGKPVMISIYAMSQPGPSKLFDRIYELSRKIYAGE